jgi:hypothetical protein
LYIWSIIKSNKNKTIMKTTTPIRVRIYPLDYNGEKSNMTYVCYVESIEDAEKKGWKYELA